jgi:UDP-N-acetylmuramate: L-alanyl-gamma-D-glutamyl-meso-diaminopimelate ligase
MRDDLIIYTSPEEFKSFLFTYDLNDTTLLLMSSGNYGGLNFDELKQLYN